MGSDSNVHIMDEYSRIYSFYHPRIQGMRIAAPIRQSRTTVEAIARIRIFSFKGILVFDSDLRRHHGSFLRTPEK
jgi:hypothetical protein